MESERIQRIGESVQLSQQVIVRNPDETITGVKRDTEPTQEQPQQVTETPQQTASMSPTSLTKQLARPLKVVIGLPMKQEVEFRWFINFINVMKQSPHGINTDIIVGANYGVAESRQKIVDTFLGMPDATHLLFMDTDMFPVDYAITTLINDNLPVVSGVYFNSLFTGMAAWSGEQALDYQTLINQYKDNPLIQVDKVGLGFCMIAKDVLQAMVSIDRPWFYFKGSDGGASEDFYFFSLIRRLGIKPVIDLRVQLQHMKNCMIAPNKAISL